MKTIFHIFCLLILASSALAQSCAPSKSERQLDINNVKTTLQNSGSLWWNNISAKYEVPKGSGVHALFAGGLWIGGLDNSNLLHTSAMTYRQNGNDYWPGPLDTTNVTTYAAICNQYDRIWKVDRKTVDEFRKRYNDVNYQIPLDILEWPGNGDVAKGQAKKLAPYVDVNSDGFYNPHDGDYPAFNFTNIPDCSGKYLLGDQALWWVFNDKGNTHTETGGLPFGVEIHCMAYAYKSIDEIGTTTFYQYKIINRSSTQYNKVYMGQWVDVDLGYYNDDYVQCDVSRSMGIGLNGNPVDGTGYFGTYGEHPPAIGIDLLQGPKATDPSDGVDEYGTDFKDVNGYIAMTKFVYYNNDFTVTGNPQKTSDYYNYLRGFWKDSIQFTYGGNAKGGTTNCNFMFPGSSDPTGKGTGGIPQAAWSEASVGNLPADRRFIMSSGPFTMKPGNEQLITTAVIWARDFYGGNIPSLTKLTTADDKIQDLFNSCFDTTKICNVPYASFSMNTNKLTTNFSCPVDGQAYAWHFGDGATSSLQNPSHTYANSGTYTISLKVIYPCGTDSIAQSTKVYQTDVPVGVRLQRMEGQGNGGWALDMEKESVDSIFSNPSNRVLHPIYSPLRGPVLVDVLDSSLLPKGKYAIQFSDTTENATWKLFKYGNGGLGSDTVYSTATVSIGNYQLIPNLGLAVHANYVTSDYGKLSINNVLESSMEFTDPTKNWLTGLADNDSINLQNWIRSGVYQAPPPYTAVFDDYFFGNSFVDPSKKFEKILNGTWAPYRMCAFSDPTLTCVAGPAYSKYIALNDIKKNLASVDVIITSDKSRWTRCPVLELNEETVFAVGATKKMDMRASPSVDKNGIAGDGTTVSSNPNDPGFIAARGMGWFPGYAINMETGERLNMAFGEDSGLPVENGRDMLWNPTENIWAAGTNPLFGGKHYIYIFAHANDYSTPPLGFPNLPGNMPRYDSGLTSWKLLNALSDQTRRVLYGNAMWVNIPLLNPGHTLLESDVKIRLRVAQPYRYGYSAKNGANAASLAVVDTLTGAFNKNFPLYNFDAEKIAVGIDVHNAVPLAVTAQPNPFDTHTNFIFENLTVPYQLSIYNVTGQKVRHYENINDKQFVLQRGNLDSGIYFYYVLSSDNRTKIGKLVVK